MVLSSGATLSPQQFGVFLAGQPDLSPKARPRYVWIADDLPTTATNKILKRTLIAQGIDVASGVLWQREGRGGHYRLSGRGF